MKCDLIEDEETCVSLEMKDAIESGEIVDADGVIEGDATVPSVVKMKLNTFCNNTKLCSSLRKLVTDMNQLQGEAYAFSNFHILRILDAGLPIPPIDRNFYYRCLLAVGNSDCRESTLSGDFIASIVLFDQLRPAIEEQELTTKSKSKKGVRSKTNKTDNPGKIDIREYNQVIADTSITMATMGTNHLLMNLEKRIKTWLKLKYPGIKSMHPSIVYAVVSEPATPLDKLFAKSESQPKATKKRKTKTVVVKTNSELERIEATMKLREMMPLKTKPKFASKAHLTLPLYHMMLKDTDAALKEHQELSGSGCAKAFKGRSFSLLPYKHGYTTSHFHVSSMQLFRLLRTGEDEDYKLLTKEGIKDGRDLDAHSIWKKHFNLNIVETRTRKFANRIVTDGYAVGALMNVRTSLHTSRNGSDSSIDDINRVLDHVPPTSVLKVGIDPGFTDVVTASFDDGTSFSYSSSAYYEEAKVKYSNRRTNGWNKETSSIVPTSKCKGKTADRSLLDQWIREYLATSRELHAHRLAKGYRKLRFLRFSQKKKAIHRICNIIAPPEYTAVCIGFGDWSGGYKSPISRKSAGPIQDIKRELRKRKNTLFRMTDEHCTSKFDSDCFLPLSNMKAKVTTVKKGGERTAMVRKVHKVLHCKNSDGKLPQGCRETTWNRDINASRNILMLFQFEIQGISRPLIFCRSQKNTKILLEAEKGTVDDVAQTLNRSADATSSTGLRSLLSGKPAYPRRIHR